MIDIRIGSTNYAQDSYNDTQAPAPAPAGPQPRPTSNELSYVGSTNYGTVSPSQTYLPNVDDTALSIDIHRIISEAQEERREDVKERALTASVQLQDMMAQYNAAMERFREAQSMAQMAMSEGGQYDSYLFDACAAAGEASELAQQMTALAPEFGGSTDEVAAMAQAATDEANAAIAQAEQLIQTAESSSAPADAPVDAAPVLIEDVAPPPATIDQAQALLAQLTAPNFVPANVPAAQLTATALMQLVTDYNASTAAQLAPTLSYWTDIAEQHLAAGTVLDDAAMAALAASAAAANTPAAPVALQTSAFWSIGDAGAVGTQTVAGQATTPDQYIQDKALAFVTRTVTETEYVSDGESSYAVSKEVERQFAVSIGEIAREQNLDAARAAAYLAQNGAYLMGDGSIGTSAQFQAAHGRAPSASDSAYLVSPETLVSSGEGGDYTMPATYGTAQQHLAAVGHDIGVYGWLPADVMAAAQASTGGHVLLAASDQVVTVQAHLDEQSTVFMEKLVSEYASDNYGEGGTYLTQVLRQVPVPVFAAAAELGLSGAALAEYVEANRAYMLSSGEVGTRAQFEAAEHRAPGEADRAYIVQGPSVTGDAESGQSIGPALFGTQAAYLDVIGLSQDTPRDLTISFNNSMSGGGDAYLDTSHRSIDLTVPGSAPTRAFHAIANDELAGEWVQIGDIGPLNDDVAKILGDLYGEFGADTPEKQEVVRSMLFRYDPNYGVIANRDLIEGAVEMNNNRRQGFFEKGVGRALVTVVASLVAGPWGAAAAGAIFAAADGGSFADIVRAGLASYAGGYVGAGVGNMVTGALASSTLSATAVAGISGFAQGISSSFTSQLIATGKIDGDALLAAGIGGGVGGAVSTAISGTEMVANLDASLGLAPGTAARLIGGQAGSLAGTGGLSWENALLTLGGGAMDGSTPSSLITDGPSPVDSDISEYEALGYTPEQAEVWRSMGVTPDALSALPPPPDTAGIKVVPTDPKAARMMAVDDAFKTLSANPNLTVEMRTTPQGAQVIDIWTRDGTQVTYNFSSGELMGTRTNLDLVATGIGAKMSQVNSVADELRTNPNLSVTMASNYRTGAQQILINSPGQPPVQYNYKDGAFVSVTYPNQVSTTAFYVTDTARNGIPDALAKTWAERAITGQSLISSSIPSDVVASGQLATVAVHTSEPGQAGRDAASGVLAVATIDGVDRAVLLTANHVVNPGENTIISARDSMGRLVQIPVNGQTILSSGVVDGNRINLGKTDDTDGYLVTLSPETLNALRPGVSLASLPRIGPPPANGEPIFEFGFAAWGNVNAAGQYQGMNLVGASGAITSNTNGVITTGMAVSNTNPPVTGGMSGGPVFVQMADGSIQVVGVLARAGALPGRWADLNQMLGTNFVSNTSRFASLYWLLYRGGKP